MEENREHESAGVVLYNLAYMMILASQIAMYDLAKEYGDKYARQEAERIDKAAKFFKAGMQEMEFLDKDLARLGAKGYDMLMQDANELLSLGMLYLYRTYDNMDNMYATFKFLRELGPITPDVAAKINYFRQKSK